MLLDAAVDGRRLSRCRGSWRRFDTPASLLNDEVDLAALWLLEKLRWMPDADDDEGGRSNRFGHILALREKNRK